MENPLQRFFSMEISIHAVNQERNYISHDSELFSNILRIISNLGPSSTFQSLP